MAGGYAVLEGRAEDARLRAVRAPELRRRSRPRSAGGDRQAAIGRAAAGPSATTRASRPTPSWTRSSRAMSSRISPSTTWWLQASTPRRCGGSSISSTTPSTNGAKLRPGPGLRAAAFGKDRRMPITNLFRASPGCAGRRARAVGRRFQRVALPQLACLPGSVFEPRSAWGPRNARPGGSWSGLLRGSARAPGGDRAWILLRAPGNLRAVTGEERCRSRPCGRYPAARTLAGLAVAPRWSPDRAGGEPILPGDPGIVPGRTAGGPRPVTLTFE